MSPVTVGLIGVVLVILLTFAHMRIAIVMIAVGFGGFFYLSGFDQALYMVGSMPYSTFAHYTWSLIPLFILMGFFAFHAGITRELFNTVNKWVGHFRGGLAMASVAACAAFAALSGSSLATAGTMGAVAIPEMERYNYDARLSTGAVAAGGSIGILIPPSIILVIYAIMTEQSIAKLFMAGVIPGILEALFYIVTIYILCKRNPLLGPKGPRTVLRDKVVSLRGVWAVVVLISLVLGGIYLGVFTPSEAAGIGATGALVIGILRRKLTWEGFKKSISDTIRTTAMLMILLVGAFVFACFLAVSRLPNEVASYVVGLSVNRYIILMLMIFVYLVLGCFMDPLTMVLITMPVFFPAVLALGFDPIWFGIIVVRVIEMALITPPLGENVYVIKGVVGKDIPLSTIFKGILPFLMADICHVALLVAFPSIALFLPSLM